MFRQFCLYLCHIGKECYIPKLPKKEYSDFTPYVFTRGQIQDIFETCDKQRMYSHNIYCNLFALPTLYRILYATGIRIGEAISIRNRDVDLRRNCIIVRKTKNKMERLIPLSGSLSKVLQQYLEYRNKMPLPDVDAPDKFLLISPSGRPLSSCTVLGGFKKVLENAIYPVRATVPEEPAYIVSDILLPSIPLQRWCKKEWTYIVRFLFCRSSWGIRR